MLDEILLISTKSAPVAKLGKLVVTPVPALLNITSVILISPLPGILATVTFNCELPPGHKVDGVAVATIPVGAATAFIV